MSDVVQLNTQTEEICQKELFFGLEGTLKILNFHPSCHRQRHLPLDQAALTHAHINTDTQITCVMLHLPSPEVHFVSFLADAALQNQCNQG